MWISDPNHHRANGNLKYFEFQLEKQRKAEAEKKEVEDKKREQKVLDKRDAQRKRSKDPLPERKKYEMLCRGEGVKLVSRKNKFFSLHLHVLIFFLKFFLMLSLLADPTQTKPSVLPLLWQQSQSTVAFGSSEAGRWVGPPTDCPLSWHHLWQWDRDGEGDGKTQSELGFLKLCCGLQNFNLWFGYSFNLKQIIIYF